MGQKQGRQRGCSHDAMASPVFAVDKVRGEKGAFSVTSRYHLHRSLQQDYKVERNILGSGASGPVHLATRGNRRYAVKSFRKRGLTQEAKLELRGEVEVYLKLDHPHVARLEDVYETDRELHLVMELMSGGELYARLAQRRHYSEEDAATTCRQMLLAVAYLHAHNIVHRDLKLENFLYERQDTEHLKLIDFGFAKYHERGAGKMSRSCGSLHYIAPEVLKHSYDEKADMWSLGVIMYMLLTGNPPFYGSTDEKCLYRIQRGEPSFSKKWWKLSGGAQTFVLSLLSLDPEARPSAADALRRPWICIVETPKATIDGEVLASLRSFAQASHFRRACLSMMAWSLTLEDQAELRHQFQLLDTSKTGTISQQELANVLKANFNIDSAETETLFKGLDTKGAKEISYAEFLAAAMKKRMRMHEDVLHSTFERFDVEGNGEITSSNLRALLGDSFEGEDVEELIREADCDGDGRVSYADFLSYLREGDADRPPCDPGATEEISESSEAGDDAPKIRSRTASTLDEQSTRFRARREFTEIIDTTLLQEDAGGSHCSSLAPLTPKHPRAPSPPKQRKALSPPKQRKELETADSCSSASGNVFAAQATDTTTATETPRKPGSSSATATPPLATSPEGSAHDLQSLQKPTAEAGQAPLSPPREITQDSVISLPQGSVSEDEVSCRKSDTASLDSSLSPFLPPTPDTLGGGLEQAPRWKQCVRPISFWPPWRCRSSSAEQAAVN